MGSSRYLVAVAPAGIAAKLSRNRAAQIKDPVVRSYGELETAIEVGPSAGVSVPALLNPYDSLRARGYSWPPLGTPKAYPPKSQTCLVSPVGLAATALRPCCLGHPRERVSALGSRTIGRGRKGLE